MWVYSQNLINAGNKGALHLLVLRSPTQMDLNAHGPLNKMKRSKSLGCLSVDMQLYQIDSCEWGTKSLVDDSGMQSVDGFNNLEKKVDKLSDICAEQARALSELAELVRSSRKHELDDEQLIDLLGLLLQKLVQEREAAESTDAGGARSLLSAIEARPTLERRISDALTELLQSEDLKQRIVSSTAASVKELIRSLFSVEVSSLYVPIMERAHRQLLKHVTKLVAAAFTDLEENTVANVEALRETSRALQAALRQHGALLADARGQLAAAVAGATEKVLEQELQHWREEAAPAASECGSGRAESPAPEPGSPRAGELSAVDRMMMKAEIHKLMREGDANGAFSRALLALDLELVAAACRAAPRAPSLAPPVLLSLLQQLAADLLLDTPLKCSYIEYALQNLDPSDPITRTHLPLVLTDLQRHISEFLHKYPRHALAHRIYKIYETARNLL